MELVDVLENTISLNQEERAKARHYLEIQIATEFDKLTLALSLIMADEWQWAAVGMQAAEELLHVLYSPQAEQQRINEERWLQVPKAIRAQIKENCCQALDMPEEYRHTAAQCVARIACIELPGGHWPRLLKILGFNIIGKNYTQSLKLASLEVMGYIDIEDWDVEPVNFENLLHSISHVLIKRENNNVFRLAAARALRRILVVGTPFAEEMVCCEIIPDICYTIFPRACMARAINEQTGTAAELMLELVHCLMEFTRRRYRQMIYEDKINVIRDFIHIINKALVSGLNQIVLLVLEFIIMVCEVILGMMQTELSYKDRSTLAHDQWLLCKAIQSALPKIDGADAENVAAKIMDVLNGMIEGAQSNISELDVRIKSGQFIDHDLLEYMDLCDRHKIVLEEVFMAVNAVITAIGSVFSNYFSDFMPKFLVYLQYFVQWKIFKSAVVLLVGLSLKLSSQLLPYLKQVFPIIFSILKNPTTAHSLRLQIISAIGDFARYLGDNIVEYRGEVIKALIQVCEAKVNIRHRYMINDLNLLRLSSIETLVVLIQGTTVNIENDHIKSIINFIGQIGTQKFSSCQLIGACCNMVEIITPRLGENSLEILGQLSIIELLERGSKCETSSTKDFATSAIQVLHNLKKEDD